MSPPVDAVETYWPRWGAHVFGAPAISTLRRENDAEKNTLVAAYLFRSADMSTTVGRRHIVNLIGGDDHPFAVHFDFIMISNHARRGR